MSNQDTADTESGVRLASRCHVRSCPGGRTMRTLQSSPGESFVSSEIIDVVVE